MRPSVGDGPLGERRRGGDDVVPDVPVQDADLNDGERIGDAYRHGTGETLLPVLVSDDQGHDVNTWGGERVGHLRAVAEGAVGKGPVPHLNVR